MVLSSPPLRVSLLNPPRQHTSTLGKISQCNLLPCCLHLSDVFHHMLLISYHQPANPGPLCGQNHRPKMGLWFMSSPGNAYVEHSLPTTIPQIAGSGHGPMYHSPYTLTVIHTDSLGTQPAVSITTFVPFRLL